jgi:hypothetical protein
MIKSDSHYEYVGSIHIHSNYSDGLRPIPEIAKIAEKSGLDFLLFADHMTLEPQKIGLEKWFGPVLSIIGYEINDEDNKNHYLAFGLEDVLPKTLTAQEYVAQAHEQGAIGFIAHPDEKRSALPDHPPYPWLAWDAEGYDGIEIWNHSSEWLERLTHTNKYLRILHPLSYLEGPPEETLARWDKLNRTSVMAGIGGTDAHAYPYRFGPITVYIFRYKVLFKGIRTHVILDQELSEDVTESKNAVLQALKNARCFISNHRWGDAQGFQFNAVSGNTKWMAGDTVEADSVRFVVKPPAAGEISLLRNGEIVAAANGKELSYLGTVSGAYRVEIRRKGKPWIYSNHIRLQKKKS